MQINYITEDANACHMQAGSTTTSQKNRKKNIKKLGSHPKSLTERGKTLHDIPLFILLIFLWQFLVKKRSKVQETTFEKTDESRGFYVFLNSPKHCIVFQYKLKT